MNCQHELFDCGDYTGNAIRAMPINDVYSASSSFHHHSVSCNCLSHTTLECRKNYFKVSIQEIG